jgi:signal transduction histidine kinase
MALEQQQRADVAMRRLQEIIASEGQRMLLLGVVIVPAVIAWLVPGVWWLISFGCLCAAGAFDFVSERLMRRRLARAQAPSPPQVRRLTQSLMLQGSLSVGLFVLPNLLLAFAPAPGPWIGLSLCTMALTRQFTNQKSTRAMTALNSPVISAGIVVNALAVGGVIGAVLAVIGLLANMLANARSDSISLGELIEKQCDIDEAARGLEQRVNERTADLRDAMQAAEAANQAKSHFLTKMTHELRTPLNAIIGYSEIVEEDLASNDTAECPAHLARVRQSAKHLLSVIDDVLDFSVIEAQTLALREEAIDCRMLALEALDAIAATASANKSKCELIVSPGAETLFADRARLKQCLIHLLSNAAKFTEGGRIIVHVRAAEINGAPAIAFEISDNGVGISKDAQARLFQPFVQADDSITRGHDGSGLGLAITRRLARLMGGEVTLESELGTGARFTLLAPRARGAKSTAPKVTAAA